MREVIEVSKQLSMTIAGAKRFFAVMDDIPTVIENGSSPVTISNAPTIEVSDVWFRYGEPISYVLKGGNFSIPSGSTVAIVGMTGAKIDDPYPSHDAVVGSGERGYPSGRA